MNHTELIEYIEGLQKRVAKHDDENLLTIALLADDNLHEILGHAAREVGKLDWFLDVLQTACEATLRDEDEEEHANQMLLLGEVLFTQAKDEKKAIELWESVLKNKNASKGVLQQSSDNLSQIYHREATTAEATGGKPRLFLSKLEKLAKYDSKLKTTTASGAAMLLGLWFQQHGNLSEAKYCCFADVNAALDELNEANLDKDRYAMSTLGSALMKAGDNINAEAAYSVEMEELGSHKDLLISGTEGNIVGPEMSTSAEVGSKEKGGDKTTTAINALREMDISEDKATLGTQKIENSVENFESNTRTLPEPVIKEENTPKTNIYRHIDPVDRFPDAHAVLNQSSWFCDGNCRRKTTAWKEFYICKICLGSVSFCEKCLVLVKEDMLPFRVCNPKHTFWRAYPIREGFGIIGDRKIGNGEEKEPEEQATWVARVRKEWQEFNGQKTEVDVIGRV
jgi:hypothetical protein